MLVPILHFLGFQACWFATVLAAADGNLWLGPICIAIFVAIHISVIARRVLEFIRLVVAALLGVIGDSLLTQAGVLQFGPDHETLSPVWMISLWALFMATLPVTMPWLRGRYWIGALVGAIAGPFCYFAGAKLGALAIAANELQSAAWIAMEWLIATPILILITERSKSWLKDQPLKLTPTRAAGVSR